MGWVWMISAASASRGRREAAGIPESDPLVLFLGRKDEPKGLLTLLEAMTRLWSQGSPARLALVGATTPFSEGELAAASEEGEKALLEMRVASVRLERQIANGGGQQAPDRLDRLVGPLERVRRRVRQHPWVPARMPARQLARMALADYSQ